MVFDAGGLHRAGRWWPRRAGCGCSSAPPAVIADDVIRELVAAEPHGRVVVVVTSDHEVVRDVTPGRGPRRGGAGPAARPRS